MTAPVNEFDGVPGFIGGGDALNTAEQLRLLNWNTFRGQEGFMTQNAGRTETLLTPGEGVRLLPGPFVINSRYPGCEMEAYINRLRRAQIVETTPVPPGAGRRDAIIVRIRDPYPEEGLGLDPIPFTDEQKRRGPYCFGEVVEDVPPGTFSLEQLGIARQERGYTALMSSRLDRPGNTATVTNDMIKRTNIVCNPFVGVQIPQEVFDNIDNNISDIIADINGIKAQRVPVPSQVNDVVRCSSANNNFMNWSQYLAKRFPNEAADFVNVPTWANWASVLCIISNVIHTRNGANARVNLAATYRIGSGLPVREVRLKQEDLAAGDYSRRNLIVPVEIPIATVDKGKKVTHELLMTAGQGSERGIIQADEYTSVYYSIQFKERPNAVAV